MSPNSNDAPEERLREALVELLRADQEYIHKYDALLFGPRDHRRDPHADLQAAERRVDAARREAIRWEELARQVHAQRGPDADR